MATPISMLVTILVTVSVALSSASEEKFRIYALEKGVIVEEKLDVDPEDGTIKISMPAHNTLDKMTLISDFKLGLTMRLMPDYNVCYLSRQDTNQFPVPETLARNVEMQKTVDQFEELWVDTPNITYSYIIRPGTLQDRSGLSVAMRELCDDIPIRIIEQDHENTDEVEVMENGLELLPRPPPMEEDDEVERRKRQTFCAPEDEKSACLLKNSFCHYVTTCELKYDPDTRQDFEDCGKKHEFGKARCCRICCNDADSASDDIPYCKELKSSDMFKYCQLDNKK